MATPTVRKLQLGNELRRLREEAGVTPAEASTVIDCDTSKISRLEQGQTGITLGDLTLLLQRYDTEPALTASLIALSRGNRERGRWTGDRATFPEWFRMYVDLEGDAEDIRWAEVEIIPGILQTEKYIRALFASAEPLNGPTDVDLAVRSRLGRQELFDRAAPPTVSFVLSESCIRRIIGDRALMADQLGHLAAMAERPNVQLQLRMFDSAATASVGYRFTMLRIPAPGTAPALEFAYVENGLDARYLEDRPALRQFGAAWNALQAAALDPEESRRRLLAIAREYREGAP